MRTEADARRDPQPGDEFRDGSGHCRVVWRGNVTLRYEAKEGGEQQATGLRGFVRWASDARRVDVVRVAQEADHA